MRRGLCFELATPEPSPEFIHEVFLFFLLGMLLVIVEIFFFPGSLVFAFGGLVLILGSLVWAMVDIWPSEPFSVSPDLLAKPMMNLVFGLAIAATGAFVSSRFFPGSWLERSLVLSQTAGGDGQSLRDQRKTSFPKVGVTGVAVTDLFPGGQVEICGQRYDALASLGTIDRGNAIRVQKVADFSLIVEPILNKGKEVNADLP